MVHVLLRQLCTEDRWRQSPNPQFHTVVQVYWPRIHFNLRKKKNLSQYIRYKGLARSLAMNATSSFYPHIRFVIIFYIFLHLFYGMRGVPISTVIRLTWMLFGSGVINRIIIRFSFINGNGY